VTVRKFIANAVTTVGFSVEDIDKIKTCKHFSIQVTSEFWGFHGHVVRYFALLGCGPSAQHQAELFKITYKKNPSFGGANSRDPRCSPFLCSIAVLDVSYDGF
jgi:hypothetical protein